VRIWDARGGRQLLSLEGHRGPVYCVVFSADGTRLASASGDSTVRVWAAKPLTPADLDQQDAAGLVRSLFARPLFKGEILARLRGDKAISKAVRQDALALAASGNEDPQLLNNASWEIVRQPGATPAEYAQAARWVQTASRLAPDESNVLNTLGVAQYRAGLLPEALQTLTRSDKLHRDRQGDSHPTDLAVVAMVHYRLGHKDQAGRYLDRLREAAGQPPWAKDDDSQALLREAEALLHAAAESPAKAHTAGRTGH
jgi:tetratricopeptide (TPR) repeat protein